MITFCNIGNPNPRAKRRCYDNPKGIYLIFAFCKYKMTLCVDDVVPPTTENPMLLFLQ